ncbi:hypothetical protein SLS62_007850 [Diatrype stigma]|uniref:DNA/RNA-binding protein Kin17 WH-like domain-containing protein n=1 Tax=Diatrype stigma TaxID=117547 RepID=A0AAN9UQ44_9PEZI
MLLVGEDPKKYIHEYSNQFKKDFLQLLRTSHGEKPATKWPSLTEFAKYLGREGICRVEETDKGLHIAWVDDSPEALRRRDAVRRKEMQDKGDEEREQRMIREQIKRARREAASGGGGGGKEEDDAEEEAEARELKRQEGEKIKLSFGAKSAAPSVQPSKDPPAELLPPPPDAVSSKPPEGEVTNAAEAAGSSATAPPPVAPAPAAAENPAPASVSASGPVSLKMGAVKPQTKNVFAAAKKNALAGGPKKKSAFEQPKKVSEAERIMKEEMERKRARGSSGFSGANKRQKM